MADLRRDFRITLALVGVAFACAMQTGGSTNGQLDPLQGQEPRLYKLVGHVRSEDGKPVASSTVIAFDQASGWPLSRNTYRAVEVEEIDQAQDGFLHQRTDGNGKFVFWLPEGNYRLVAQRWLGSGDAHPFERFKLLGKNSAEIHLDGVVEQVLISATDTSEPVVCQPLGSARVSFDLKLSNDSSIILLSRNPLAADPVLGFAAWSGSFWPGVIGGNRMLAGKTTFSGLPQGEIHVAFFANDNNPGFGGATLTMAAGEQRQASFPIIASWSDGHKDPPKRLQELVVFLTGNERDAERIQRHIEARIERMNEPRPGPMEYLARLVPLLNDPIKLSNGQTASVADCAAALAYVRLAKSKR